MNPVSRPVMKAKKKPNEQPKAKTEPVQQHVRSQPKTARIKRKSNYDLEHQPYNKRSQLNEPGNSKQATPKITSVTKYSANDRLRKYRKSLGERIDDVVKVHQVFATSAPVSKGFESDLSSISPIRKRSLKVSANRSEPYKKNPIINRSYSCTKSAEIIDCNSSSSSSFPPSVPNWLSQANGSKSNVSQLKTTITGDALNISEVIQYSKCDVTNNTSNASLVNESSRENLDADMEWSPIDVEDVVSDIQKLRQEKALTHKNNGYDNRNSSCTTNNVDDIYIVIDTNVFISNLNTVRDILNYKPNALQLPIVIVPWMVIQELDFFKEGHTESDGLKNSARRAVKFINSNLTSKNPRLKGQTVQDASKQDVLSSNPDDGILFCCIQLTQQSKTTVLLSNDVNLRNKALIHGIPSYGTSSIVAEIGTVLCNNGYCQETKGQQIISTFTNLCIHIIDNEMKSAYGAVTDNLISKPPWGLKQCLTYMKRFWIPVFSMVIPQKQFIKIVEDMICFHTIHEELSSEEEIEEFMKLCLSMCVYFKNCLVKYKQQIQKCINSVQEIASTE